VVSTGLTQGLAQIEGFDQAVFQARVRTAYLALQHAWTQNRWQTSRPYVTDRMFQTLRFWMDQYEDAGLNNVLEEVELLEARPVDAQTDRWFHAVTVRIVGRMKDSTVDEKGRLVSGNPDRPRRFAEYWTFLRSVDPAPSKGATDTQCPSCGAPLDRVDETGICGYCSSKITSGRFDWVLSRIEQPQAYR
jgi:predicted lipid-binding transport protein (Tim44 family)